jgi:transcription elongation factor GreA
MAWHPAREVDEMATREEGIVMTREGYEDLIKELEHLKVVERKAVAERIRDSKQFGEFLENSEYEEAKAEQAVVEGRILELQRILQNAVVVEKPSGPAGAVAVGSLVTLRDTKSRKQVEYRIVSPVEADPANGRISYESPVGRAIMGRSVGDKVQVTAPSGTTSYVVAKVSNRK